MAEELTAVDSIAFDIVARPVYEADSADPMAPHGGGDAELRFTINARPLTELVAEYERPLAAAEGQPGLEGTYLPLTFRRAPHDLLYAEATFEHARDDGRMTLMGCECGTVDCWPLVARITVEDDRIVWEDFTQPFRSWDYSGFGPFEFDRAQYDAAVDELDERLADVVRYPKGWRKYLHALALRNVEDNAGMYRTRLSAARSIDRLPLERMGRRAIEDRSHLNALVEELGRTLAMDRETALQVAALDPDYLRTRPAAALQRVVDELEALHRELLDVGPPDTESADAVYTQVMRRILWACSPGRAPDR